MIGREVSEIADVEDLALHPIASVGRLVRGNRDLLRTDRKSRFCALCQRSAGLTNQRRLAFRPEQLRALSEQAFNVAAGLDDRVSAEFGIDSIQGTTCTTNDDCNTAQSESCAIREGETEGTCIETWFGICHAWAPVAIMEAEPQQPVTYNGVTFAINDLKALATLQYGETLDTRFMSLRCDERANGEGWALDAYGNPTNQSCADTNAGSFHVVVTNLLGLRGESFVEDRTFTRHQLSDSCSVVRLQGTRQFARDIECFRA